MIKMRALRAFGYDGVNEGHMKRGREFSAGSEQRAKELEAHGLAFRLPEMKAEPKPLNKMDPPPQNKAAQAGPLDFPGGETGAETASSSSDQGRPRRRRVSQKQKDGLDL